MIDFKIHGKVLIIDSLFELPKVKFFTFTLELYSGNAVDDTKIILVTGSSTMGYGG
jgi:hypothetical protein